MENENKHIQDISAITVSSKVLAYIIGKSDRMVRQWGQEGVFVRVTKGRYNLVESLKNYILNLELTNNISTSSEVQEGELDLEQEKAKKERVNRIIAELKLAKMKGEVHDAKDVEAVMSDMLAAFRSRLMSVPAKVSPVLENRNAGYINDYLKKEIVSVLNELKDYNPEDFYGKEYIEPDEDEEEDD